MEWEKALKCVVDSTNKCFSQVAIDMNNAEKGLENVQKKMVRMQKKQAKQGLIIFNLASIMVIGGMYFSKKIQDLSDKIDEVSEEVVTNLDEIVTNPCGMCADLGVSDDLK